jgi:cysteine-S-conjugate beta-lyase
MSDGQHPDGIHWRTRLIHSTANAPDDFHALAPAIHRGSTVVFERLADAIDDWRASSGYTYGLFGTPTTLELGLKIAELERATHTFVVPGGQAAIALIYLAYCKAGSHVLVPESAYGPNRDLARGLLAGFGVEVERYDPMLGGAIAELIRDNTTLIWCESPGSITMEVQDVPAIVAAAHARGVTVALDNTYAAGVLFDAFAAKVDVSMQALTKYVGGHSDLLLGTVSVANEAEYERVGRMHRLIGMAVSPDDCALALRGLKTLGVRLDRLERTALTVATWLSEQPEVSLVLHPALPDCPGHDTWKRDFTGSASIFSIVLQPDWDRARIVRFVEALELFKIGFSWGGVTSLVMAYPHLYRRVRHYDNRIVRLNVGLEEPDDLIADLRRAFRAAVP